MVFQNYALYPHKTVFENLAFPLKLQGLGRREIDERVTAIARLLELEEQLKRRPRQLSGGQRQRVAMGRAIVREPQAFLMDEPLSNLDAKLRTQMRAEIGLLHKELSITTIYVTHDQVEAMTLGQRVAVMRKGELQQVDAPQVLYDRPANLFVAGFIGSPAMNFFEGGIRRSDGRLDVAFGEQRLSVEAEEVDRHAGLAGYDGRTVIVGVRPEHLEDAALVSGAADGRRFRGLVQLRELLGSEVVVHFQVEAAPAVTDEVREIAEDVDAAVADELDQQRRRRRTAFVGRFDVGTGVREDESAEVAVAPGALRFFDPDTGHAIGA
jgi:multiple sugar transport system ATP-binding protein